MDAAFQTAFVTLVTQDAARAAFLADPSAMVAGLPPRAQAALVGVTPAALTRYAESLKAKRWRGLAAVVPLTRRVCPSLGGRYRRWLGAHPSPGDRMGLSPGESEGLRCLHALRQQLRNDDGEADWAGDLLAFEVLRACAHRDGKPRTLRARFAVHAIIDVLRTGALPDPDPAPHVYRLERHRVRWRTAS